MFEWRVYEQLSVSGIARRLTARGAPSRDAGPWSPDSVNRILRNPKYTGRVVIGRTRNDGDARTPELGQLTATQPARPDPALLDELPYAPELLGNVPDHIRATVYAAFQVHVLYRQDQHQATIRATITDATPQIIQALQYDPRTDSIDIRGNMPDAPMTTKSRHDHENGFEIAR